MAITKHDMMRELLTIIASVILSVAAEKTVKLDDDIYIPSSIIYTAENDIVDVHMSKLYENIIFIVEANLLKREYKGIYALKVEGETIDPQKVLDNGKCVTSDNTTVFFGASDGIYTYNIGNNKVEKYGNITIDVKAIQKDTNKNLIYVITDGKLKKITNMGTKIDEVGSLNDVQEIVLDKDDNVYFYEMRHLAARVFKGTYTKPKVIVGDKIVDIKGLPDTYSQIKLARAFGTALAFIDKRIYALFPNGTSVATEYVFENEPTGCFLDLVVVMLFGHHQNLYAFTILSAIMEGIGNALRKLM